MSVPLVFWKGFMTFPRLRAWVFGILFVGWLGFLAYLAARTHGQIVVARPQIERSNVVIIASLTEQDGRPASKVRVVRVLRPKKDFKEEELELKELAFFTAKQGWSGPGEYVVPITRRADKPDQITLLPLTPGYPSSYGPPETWPPVNVLIKIGDRPDELAARLAKLTGVPAARLREFMNEATANKVATINVWHVPYPTDEFAEFTKQVREAGGDVMMKRAEEARIYRATPGALAQIDEILPAR